MAYDIQPPTELPEPGYYYHFKHDPDGPLNNYAYYIYGVGHHTEGDCRAEDAFMQVYRPLYEEAYAYRNGGLFDLRPLHMFFEPAEWKGKRCARFTKIVDEAVIGQLAAIKARMYPNRRSFEREWLLCIQASCAVHCHERYGGRSRRGHSCCMSPAGVGTF